MKPSPRAGSRGRDNDSSAPSQDPLGDLNEMTEEIKRQKEEELRLLQVEKEEEILRLNQQREEEMR